jgi:hypothetical protein
MRRGAFAVVSLLVLLAVAPAAADPVEEARARVDYHLRQIDEIIQHFQDVLGRDCPLFASRVEWKQYFDAEVEQVTLLVAHVEQAWVEAKRTGDDSVRRAAKAPRKRVDEGRAVLDKLQGCAADNGASFSPLSVWNRIEREVPRRQAAIAQPR